MHENKSANELPGHRDSAARRWTLARVQASLDACVGDGPIVVLAIREPIRHDRAADGCVVVRRSASGLVTALAPLIETGAGIWVAHMVLAPPTAPWSRGGTG